MARWCEEQKIVRPKVETRRSTGGTECSGGARETRDTLYEQPKESEMMMTKMLYNDNREEVEVEIVDKVKGTTIEMVM